MLIFLTERGGPEPKPEVYAEMGQFAGELAASGKLKGGSPLTAQEDGRRVRGEGGEPIVSDGPFLETKEVIGGFFVIECDSLDEAVAIARRCPHATHGIGPVEVREVMDVGPPS